MNGFRYSVMCVVLTACIAAPPPVTIAPVVVDASAPKLVRDAECSSLLKALQIAESDCLDVRLSRPLLARPGARDRLEECAKGIDAATAKLRDPDVIQSAKYAAWATRVIGSAAVEQASIELGAAVDPVFVMALRQRAHAYASARDWCRDERRFPQSNEWVQSTQAALANLQPKFGQCVVEAQNRLSMSIAPGAKLTLVWKGLVDPNGHLQQVAQVDFPSSIRADVGLCILDIIEHVTLPKPTREAAIGSNVTFAAPPQ